jgi:hypothetical protein
MDSEPTSTEKRQTALPGSASVTSSDKHTEAMAEPRRPLGLQQVGQAAALLAATIYGSGYLIVTLHHSEFGILEFDFLKPRLLSAGVLFILLTAAPGLAAARVFRILGLSRQAGPLQIHVTPENERYLNVSRGITLGFTCFYLAYFSQFLGGPMENPKPWGMLFFCILLILVVVTAVVQRRLFNRYPKRCLLLDVLLLAGAFTVYVVYWGDFYVLLAAWYYAVGMTAVWFYRVVLDPQRRSRTEWELIVFISIVVVGFYSSLIYGKIEPRFGGGKPTPIVLYFSGTNPVSSSESTRASLVDESDRGYYVLVRGKGSRALFLRRDLVSAVYYGDDLKKR